MLDLAIDVSDVDSCHASQSVLDTMYDLPTERFPTTRGNMFSFEFQTCCSVFDPLLVQTRRFLTPP